MKDISELEYHEHDYIFLNFENGKTYNTIDEVPKRDIPVVEPIDKGIVSTIRVFHIMGFITLASCEGGLILEGDTEQSLQIVGLNTPYVLLEVDNLDTIHRLVDLVSKTLTVQLDFCVEKEDLYRVRFSMSDSFINQNYDGMFDCHYCDGERVHSEKDMDDMIDKDKSLRELCLMEIRHAILRYNDFKFVRG